MHGAEMRDGGMHVANHNLCLYPLSETALLLLFLNVLHVRIVTFSLYLEEIRNNKAKNGDAAKYPEHFCGSNVRVCNCEDKRRKYGAHLA